ncbi:FAD-binding protein [Candidatus Woesearchaeota archaeon]|nr:FAD-binding protein [Candidatus Woesearchaeota archaeon]
MNKSKLEKTITKELKGIELLFNQDLRTFSTIRLGGIADCVAKPKSLEEIQALLTLCSDKDIPYYVIAKGSDVILGNTDGVLIDVTRLSRVLNVGGLEPGENAKRKILAMEEGKIVGMEVEAGTHLRKLSRFAQDYGLSGLEFAVGIPGTIGGAAVMNAAVVANSTGDILDYVITVSPDGSVIRLSKEDLRFGYRNSTLQDGYSGYVVYSVGLALKRKDVSEVRRRTDFCLDARKHQPKGNSIGSFWIRRNYKPFKDRKDDHLYIDDIIGMPPLNCRGWSSENGLVYIPDNYYAVSFFIVREGATIWDLAQIAKKVYDAVRDKYDGLRLEIEGKFLGLTNKGRPLGKVFYGVLTDKYPLQEVKEELTIPLKQAA